MSGSTLKITIGIAEQSGTSPESEVILALAKRAERAESKLAEIAKILKHLPASENKVSPSDPRGVEKLNEIRARALNKLDCLVSDLNE